MSAVTDIYDFGGAFEPAIEQVFKDAEMVCFTPGTAKTIERPRPRVEAIFVRGLGSTRRVLVEGEKVDGTIDETRCCAWKARFQISVITQPEIDQHRSYCAAVRNIMARFVVRLNEVKLTKHKILGPLTELSESVAYKNDEGYYQTDLHYEFDFSIQDDAWAALVSEEQE
jgi:hypothetical protein